MKSEDNPTFETDKLPYEANPNKILYGICFVSNDYLESSEMKQGRKFVAAPRVYCFVTYYPLIKLFVDLIVMILSKKMKIIRNNI